MLPLLALEGHAERPCSAGPWELCGFESWTDLVGACFPVSSGLVPVASLDWRDTALIRDNPQPGVG